ncbi:MAG: hypothetical protein F6J96_05925 [Symploca sp. SIO1C2]|nr:hypothetical protein [Symploca sp. SIO1C2]
MNKLWSKVLLSLCGMIFVFLVKHSTSTQTIAGSITANSADNFVNSMGVVTHLSYTDTPYVQNWNDNNPNYNLKTLLAELGIRHIRDRMLSPSYASVLSYAPERFAQLYKDLGITLTAVIDLREDDFLNASPIPEELEFWSTGSSEVNGETINFADLIEAIEGPNEYDNEQLPDENWMETLIDYQTQLYSLVKDNEILAEKPVLMPSLIYTAYCGKIGDLSHISDKANIHSYANYPYWRFPSSTLNWYLNNIKKCSSEQPIIATETGYPTLPGEVSERTEAKYLPRLFAEYFNRGIEQTFNYEFLDIPHLEGIQAHFGLIKAEPISDDKYTSYVLTPKKSYYALKNLIDLLNDAQWDSQSETWSQPDFQPQTLNLEFLDKEASTHYLLLQKSDGNYYLLLWREIEAYNKNKGNFDNNFDKLKIKLGDGSASASQYSYDANFNYVENQLRVANNAINVKVTDDLTVIKVVLQ